MSSQSPNDEPKEELGAAVDRVNQSYEQIKELVKQARVTMKELEREVAAAKKAMKARRSKKLSK